MKFGEKLKVLRQEKGWIQQELADAVGLSVRTIKNYELGDSYPKKREVYKKFADIFSVELNYLLTEDEGFIYKGKTEKGYKEYILMQEVLKLSNDIFRSEDLKDDEKDYMMKRILEIYWDSKSEARKRSVNFEG